MISGISAGNKEIKNVANDTTDDAAVNKKQVDQALRGITGLADNAARQYASKAGANAAALAALKLIQYDPLEPTQIMAGVGNCKSQTAVALGMRITPMKIRCSTSVYLSIAMTTWSTLV